MGLLKDITSLFSDHLFSSSDAMQENLYALKVSFLFSLSLTEETR